MLKWIVFTLSAVIVVVLAGVLLLPHKKNSSPAKEKEPTMSNATSPKQWSQAPAMTLNTNKTYRAVIHTTKGDMQVDLLVKDAPLTVNNFVFLAKQNFYNNVVFHRIMKDFMVQTGDPTGTGMGGPGYKFADEPVTRDYVKGIVAMANSGPNTNGSQFFIMTGSTPLPKSYTIFGQINASSAASLKTLDAIASTPVVENENDSGNLSKPTETVAITSVTISEE